MAEGEPGGLWGEFSAWCSVVRGGGLSWGKAGWITLTEIRALAGHLEVEPLFDVVVVRGVAVGQPVLLVVRVDEVFVDRGGLCVWSRSG